MPTIASQLTRIQNAADKLRDKGKELDLKISGATINDDHKLNEVVDAFHDIQVSKGQTQKVELIINKTADDTLINGDPFILPTGYYKGLVIQPYFIQTSVEDKILNIQTLSEYAINNQTGSITPGNGFNYLDKVTYNVQSGSIKNSIESLGIGSVTVKVDTAGWISAGTYTINGVTSNLVTKVGTDETEHSIGTRDITVAPNPTKDTIITIRSGIYNADRTITVGSVASSTSSSVNNAATEDDIILNKEAWVNGTKITGNMSDHRGTSYSDLVTRPASSTDVGNGGVLTVRPIKGAYNEYSVITTDITVGSATYKQDASDLSTTNHKFEILPTDDEDGVKTSYLSKVTIDNSLIYQRLSQI